MKDFIQNIFIWILFHFFVSYFSDNHIRLIYNYYVIGVIIIIIISFIIFRTGKRSKTPYLFTFIHLHMVFERKEKKMFRNNFSLVIILIFWLYSHFFLFLLSIFSGNFFVNGNSFIHSSYICVPTWMKCLFFVFHNNNHHQHHNDTMMNEKNRYGWLWLLLFFHVTCSSHYCHVTCSGFGFVFTEF